MADLRELFQEVYLRTLRTRPTGRRSANQTIQMLADSFGVEDHARLVNIPIPYSPNLVSYWTCDTESISGGVAADWFGNNDLTLSSMSSVSDGFIAEALSGAGTGIKTSPASMPTTQITAEAWLFPTGGLGSSVIMTNGASASDTFELTLDEGGGGSDYVARFRIATVTAQTGAHSKAIFDNNWSYLAGTYDGTTITIYWRTLSPLAGPGILPYVTGTATNGGITLSTTKDLRFGNLTTGAIMDEMKLYSTGLTTQQVEHNMFNLQSRQEIGSFMPGETTPYPGHVGHTFADGKPLGLEMLNACQLQRGAIGDFTAAFAGLAVWDNATGKLHRDTGSAFETVIDVDAVAGTASLRTLGTGVQQAAAGDHSH